MKIRPAVVLSTELYHRYRPDVIVGLITTQRPKELVPTDCELRDWRQAGLHQPSFFQVIPRHAVAAGSPPDWATF